MALGIGLRVLFVTPELAPWVKAGGLGEVASDLPRALARNGVDVRVLVPAYSALREAFPGAPEVARFEAPGGALPPARLLAIDAPVPLYLLDCPAYFARPGGAYGAPGGADWLDNHRRFGLLSKVAALLASEASPLAWQPDVLHCNDWQTGLAPAYLACAGGGAATVMTLHNLAYQGLFSPEVMPEIGLPARTFVPEGVEYYGKVSFLKAGLQYADLLSTVSPTYAQEIQRPELGFGMDGVLRQRAADLSGILNGIDGVTWDPARDRHLVSRYDAGRLEAKRPNKAALQRELGLAIDPQAPLLAMVSRLVEQKGADLVIAAAPTLLREGAQLAILGEGTREFEQGLRALAAQHPGRVAVRIAFDEALTHRIEAGADTFLMPSRFEPCGLNQLYSMRYGTPPIVRRTGGLADSVVDNETGFVFEQSTAEQLVAAARRAIAAWRQPEQWQKLQRAGMARDFSWSRAARAYFELYGRARLVVRSLQTNRATSTAK